mgnify:CR=1 FL=1
MANIKFTLNGGKKTPDKSKYYPIYLRYVLGRHFDFRASIGFKVLPDWWNADEQKVRRLAVIKNQSKINSLITNLTKHFEDYEGSNKRDGIIPSRADVKKHYDSYFTKPEDNPKKLSLFDSIEEQIKHAKEHGTVSSGTVKSYKTTKEILILFNKNKYKVDFEKIDLEFYFDFVQWCESKNLSKNYIGKHIKTIKTFMQFAIDNEYTTNESFRSKKFKVLKEDVHNVYLTEDELQALWKLDLTTLPRHERARDLFLIGAYTGLRISDYNRLRKHNVKTVQGVEMIQITATKTGKEVSIPIHPIVKAILNKNDGEPPQRLPDQHINYLIKEVAQSAGIDSIEYTSQTIGGKNVMLKKYKFELVKSHTARRSFCSNAFLAGMSPIDIMRISGHRTESAFMKYIKLSSEDVAIKMSTHPFFSESSSLKIVN